MAPSTGRVAVIGDVGGQLDALRAELARLGADPGSGRLPADLTVVQVGDLVHRGPDSAGVVALVGCYLREQPGQWVQLVGNHEAQYLYPPAFDWPEMLEPAAQETLRRWWADGRMRVAVAVQAAGEDVLVTHAGLTNGYWRRVLGEPRTAGYAAAALNSFIGTHPDVLRRGGQMLGGGSPDPLAGPLWAAAGTELIAGWLRPGERLPFSQVHGHSTVADWRRAEVRGDRELARVVQLDRQSAHTVSTLPGGRIIGVDPGHGRRANRCWQALVLTAARLGDPPG